MKQYRDEYIDCLRACKGDTAGRKAALEAIERSDVWVHGQPAPFPYVPNLFGPDDLAFLQQVSSTIHSILCKIIEHYLDDDAYSALFGFSAELDRLIRMPCMYPQLLPLARVDLFLDEQTRAFKFCEFNTDGSGAMSRDLEIGRALQRGETYRLFARNHEVAQFELFDSWVQAFMESYRACPDMPDNPLVAVTDFRESGVFSDFDRFIAAFERAGIRACFVDVRSFEFDGQHLIDPSDGQAVHAVYRRAVTSEILQHPGECDAFLNAVAACKVCTVGHFRTTVVHSKVVSILLFDPATRAFLSEEECTFIDEHIPRTYRLCSDGLFDMVDVLHNKDAWIIKPEDDYGAHGVYPGVDATDEQWKGIVADTMDAGYVVQEFYPPHKVDIVLPNDGLQDGTVNVQAWQSMPGIYLYNGNPVGFYCREGLEGVIAIDHGGLCVPSFKVDCGNRPGWPSAALD